MSVPSHDTPEAPVHPDYVYRILTVPLKDTFIVVMMAPHLYKVGFGADRGCCSKRGKAPRALSLWGLGLRVQCRVSRACLAFSGVLAGLMS